MRASHQGCPACLSAGPGLAQYEDTNCRFREGHKGRGLPEFRMLRRKGKGRRLSYRRAFTSMFKRSSRDGNHCVLLIHFLRVADDCIRIRLVCPCRPPDETHGRAYDAVTGNLCPNGAYHPPQRCPRPLRPSLSLIPPKVPGGALKPPPSPRLFKNE